MNFDQRARDLLKSASYEDLWCLLVACKILLGRRTQMEGTDPQQQIDLWLRQYCEHMKAQDVAKQLDHAAVFRIARTMILENKQLEDVHAILRELAKDKRKPRGVGWLITVIEARLGKVA